MSHVVRILDASGQRDRPGDGRSTRHRSVHIPVRLQGLVRLERPERDRGKDDHAQRDGLDQLRHPQVRHQPQEEDPLQHVSADHAVCLPCLPHSRRLLDSTGETGSNRIGYGDNYSDITRRVYIYIYIHPEY